MKEIALQFLSRDPLLHMDMIEAIRRGLGEVVYAGEDGVLLTVDEGYCGMLSCDSTEKALRLLSLRPFELVAIHQAEQQAALCERFGLASWMECWQAVYPKREPPAARALDIRPLGLEHLDFMTANYRNEDSEYLSWLLEQGALYGAVVDGQIAGFIGKHAEGAMGLLEVLPAYRRRGIGQALESFMIARELAVGNTPYCQLFTDNLVSRTLQEKLGMRLSEGHICWLRKAGE